MRMDGSKTHFPVRMPRRFLIFISLSSFASAAEKVTFDDQVFPIFQQTCLNCHNPDKAKGGLDLSTFGAVLKGGSGGKVVEPGDAASMLIRALSPGAEKPMPPEGEKLSADHIAVLKSWIEGGLLENKSSSARKASKPKFETTLRSDPAAKPDGPPPMPVDLLLEPPVVTDRAAAIHAMVASPWAPLLAVTGQRQILLHDTTTLDLVGILPFPEGDPTSLAFTPDARYLIVGGGVPGKSGFTVTFDVITGARVLSVAKEFDSVLACDIRPAFDIVATGGPSRLLKIWNTETGELVKSIKKHTDWITAIDLTSDGVLLASGDRNGGVWVWESDTGTEYLTLRGHQAAITATIFRGDSNILATASEDGSVRFWEMNGGSEVKKIDAHPGGVTAFAFGRDGSSVTAGRDMKVKLWMADFNPARDLAQNLPALPTAVAMDSEGKRAFVADAQGTIRVYQTEDAKPVGEIQGNPPTLEVRLRQIAESIANQRKAVAGGDGLVKEKSSARDIELGKLTELERVHQAAAGLQKTAQAAADATPDEATAKSLAESIARSQAAELALAPARTALEAAEKGVAEATALLTAARDSIPKLEASVKHWTAATFNAKAIATRQEADTAAVTLEESQLEFSQAAMAVSDALAVLSAKRDEHQQLAAALDHSDLSNEMRDEVEATLAAIGIRITHCEIALHEAEQLLLTQRDAIDRIGPVVHEKSTAARDLLVAYRKASE